MSTAKRKRSFSDNNNHPLPSPTWSNSGDGQFGDISNDNGPRSHYDEPKERMMEDHRGEYRGASMVGREQGVRGPGTDTMAPRPYTGQARAPEANDYRSYGMASHGQTSPTDPEGSPQRQYFESSHPYGAATHHQPPASYPYPYPYQNHAQYRPPASNTHVYTDHNRQEHPSPAFPRESYPEHMHHQQHQQPHHSSRSYTHPQSYSQLPSPTTPLHSSDYVLPPHANDRERTGHSGYRESPSMNRRSGVDMWGVPDVGSPVLPVGNGFGGGGYGNNVPPSEHEQRQYQRRSIGNDNGNGNGQGHGHNSYPSQYPAQHTYAVPYAPSRSQVFADVSSASVPPHSLHHQHHHQGTSREPKSYNRDHPNEYGDKRRAEGGSSMPWNADGRMNTGEVRRGGSGSDGQTGGQSQRAPRERGGMKVVTDERGGTVQVDAKDFVACSTCRRRKIKCDGTRPICVNCSKKAYPCEFDTQLKRRGPDKTPGRRGKKPTRTNGGSAEYESVELAVGGGGRGSGSGSGGSFSGMDVRQDVGRNPSNGHHQGALPGILGLGLEKDHYPRHPFTMSMANILHKPPPPPPMISPTETMSYEMMAPISILANALHPGAGMLTETGLVTVEDPVHTQSAISLRHGRTAVDNELVNVGGAEEESTTDQPAIWMDRMPDATYARESDWQWMTGLFSPNRAEGMKVIDKEMRYFFDLNYLWFAFINRPLFFSALHHPTRHVDVQPALILAMLAMSTLIRTADQGPNAPGRLQAGKYADASRSMISQSLLLQKVDPPLAQAALILAAFEACPHPGHLDSRFASAVQMMDSIIGSIGLLSMDVEEQRVSIFVPDKVPTAFQAQGEDRMIESTPRSPLVDAGQPENPLAATHLKWSPTPQWPAEWTLAETRKDEARRLCWTASAVAASHSHWSHSIGEPPLRLYLSTPQNYALYFEAEAFLINTDPAAAKRTLWALHHRVILLWHFTLNLAHSNVEETKRIWLVKSIWEEAGVIERDLFDVKVDGGQLQKWQSRDWLLATKSLARSLVPEATLESVKAPTTMDMAKSWLQSQSEMAQIMRSLAASKEGKAPDVKTRPFFVWWFLIQLKHALDLYSSDAKLVGALVVAQGFMKNVETLRDEWHCPALVGHYEAFKSRFHTLMAQKASAGEAMVEVMTN